MDNILSYNKQLVILISIGIQKPNMAITSEQANEWLKLNVGGEKFMSTRSTLLKQETMLSKICSNSFPNVIDEDGFILIDRSGKHFGTILDYLRNGLLPILKNERDARELELEADFYCIEELRKHCQELSRRVLINMYINRCKTQKHNAKINFYQIQLGQPYSMPLMSDGKISFLYLQYEFNRRIEATEDYGNDPSIDYSNIENDLAIHVIYWKNSNGERDEKELIVQDGKVLPPECGWFMRPTWAFDGPFFHLSTKKFKKGSNMNKINDFNW